MGKLLLVVIAVLALGAPAVSRADSGTAESVVDTCRDAAGQVPEAGNRLCRGLEQLERSAAQLCRHGDLPAEVCAELDGREISDGDIAAFEESWVARALALQRQLTLDVPLRLGTLAHTHNSYNSAAYDPTLSRLDHNQLHTIDEQLRMGARAIEIDVHWAPNVHDPVEAPTTCHAQAVPTPVVVVHAGCTTEGTLREALGELEAWLAANRDEFVLLYLENTLDGDPEAHEAAAADIEETIGERVLQPPRERPAGSCVPLPVDLSPSDVLATGKQVLITGNCGPGSWGDWVHPRGAWSEGSSGEGDDYPPAPECADRERRDYDSQVIRVWEDATWLSYTASGSGSDVTPAEVRNMVRCGMNLVGFDLLRPDDGRLEALIWSWATAEPGSAGDCAYRGGDGFHAGTCADSRPFACWSSTGWAVTDTTGAWADGEQACATVGGEFAVPRSGRADLALHVVANSGEVWLDLRRVDDHWVAAGPVVA